MRRSFVLAAILAALSTPAFASAIDDGNSGLDALNNGDYDKAIALFTHALKSGELHGDDKEFAYLNRGKAYLGKGEAVAAVSDLKMAINLKPDDSDAQDALGQAQSMQASAAPAGAAPRRRSDSFSASSGSGGWGMLSTIAGKYYWQSEGNDPHKMMQYCEWTQPRQVLLCTERGKHGKVAVAEFKQDPANGKILEAVATTGSLYYGTVVASRDTITEFFYISNTPAKGRTIFAADGTSTETTQRYSGGAWTDIATHQQVQATDQEVQDSGYFKKSD